MWTMCVERAGHYVPAVSHRVWLSNKNEEGPFINLRGAAHTARSVPCALDSRAADQAYGLVSCTRVERT